MFIDHKKALSLRTLFLGAALPLFVIGCASFFLPFSPFAFANVINKQYSIELQRKALEKELKEVLEVPPSAERDKQAQSLSNKIEEAKHALSLFKHDWESPDSSIMETYYKNGTFACGNAFIPFCVIMYFVVFFVGLALTPLHQVPLIIRKSSFITGNLFAVVTLIQWLVAGIMVPAWYTKITALCMVSIGSAALFFAWHYFFTKILQKTTFFSLLQK